jgi:hypothetical protein
MTLSGIEQATFRFVAQYLNHCATISGPIVTAVVMKITKIWDYQTAGWHAGKR